MLLHVVIMFYSILKFAELKSDKNGIKRIGTSGRVELSTVLKGVLGDLILAC